MKQLINYLLFLCIGCCFSFFYDHQLYRLLALLSAVILASISYLYTRRTWTPYAMILFALLLYQTTAFFLHHPPVSASDSLSSAYGKSVFMQCHCHFFYIRHIPSAAVGGK